MIITVFHVRVHVEGKNSFEHCTVYVPTGRSTVGLAIVSITSFDRNVPGLKYVILDGGDLTRIQKWILVHIGISVDIIDSQKIEILRSKLKKFKNLLQYFDYGWSGRKFFVPLLNEEADKFMLLDVDIITYTAPLLVKKWISKRSPQNLYMVDYKNFSVISRIEMKFLLKNTVHHKNVNTGFLCINRQHVMQNISLIQLDTFVGKIHSIISDRTIHDLKTTNPVDYVYPMIEQTLYWYIVEHTNSAPLPYKEYIIFPRHTMYHTPLSHPVMIHFSGEADKESEYKYLWASLQSWFKTHKDPWYSQSSWYCMTCKKKAMI